MSRKKLKHLYENGYVAEVEVELEDDSSWAPTLSLQTAYLLDDIRDALRHGNLQRASRYAIIIESNEQGKS